jgi:hypothetical protein
MRTELVILFGFSAFALAFPDKAISRHRKDFDPEDFDFGKNHALRLI